MINRLLKNTFAMIMARGVQPLFSTILVLLIVRMWNPEDFGKYTTVFYLLAIFQVLCGFGLRNTLTREVAKNRERVNQYISSGVVIALPFSLVSIMFMVGLVHSIGYQSDVVLAADILSISLIASALGECFEGILTGLERIRSVAVIWIIETILKTGISIVLVYSGFGLLTIVFVFVVFRFFNPVACFFIIHRSIVKLKLHIDVEFSKHVLTTTYVIALIVVVSTAYWRIDAVILQKLQGDVDVALFGVVHRLFLFAQMLILSFFTAFLPVISRLFVEQKEAFQRACNKSIQYLCIINLAIALFVTVYSRNIILFVFSKNEYLDAAPTLVIFMWVLLLFSINELLGNILFVSNNQNKDLMINLIALLCKIPLCFILINQYGYIGTAIATLLSLLMMMYLKYRYVNKYVIVFQLQRLAIKAIKLCVAGLMMVFIIYLFKLRNMFVAFIFSSFIYFISLVILKMFSKEDMSFFKKWFNTYVMKKRAVTYMKDK